VRVIGVYAIVLMASATACGLEELWHCDTPCGVNAIPATLDCDGNGALDVIVPTRFDGSVWLLNQRGDLLCRYTSDRWIRGNVAVAPAPPTLAYEDTSGRITVRDLRNNSEISVLMEGRPLDHGGLCLADLDGDGHPEIVTVRRNGIVGTFDARLTPRWQYDAGASVETPPAVAPIFNAMACVYICDVEGTLHAVSGAGVPLWRFPTRETGSPRGVSSAPLVVQLAGQNPSIVFTQDACAICAVDAVEGNEQWRVRIDAGNLGSPAVFTPREGAERELLVVSDKGAVLRLDCSGNMLERSQLPPGDYVPQPLVADVDGNQQLELLVAGMSGSIVIASLNGKVKETLDLRGNADAGMALADIDQNSLLELLAATDRARLYCFGTQAKDGWTHSHGNPALSGYVPPIASRDWVVPRRPSRHVRIESLTVNSYAERSPFAVAFFRARKQAAARYISAVIRCGDKVAGATFRPFDPRGLSVRFVRTGSEEPTLEVNLHDGEGKIVASSSDIPIRPGAARLVELTPLDNFFETLSARGNRYVMPASWALPRVLDRDSWHVARFLPARWQQPREASQQPDLLAEAVPLIEVQKGGRSWMPFGPDHEDWPAISANAKPFLVETQLEKNVPRGTYEAIRAMAGKRFLGFLDLDGDALVRKRWANRFIGNPRTHGAFTEALTDDLQLLSAENYGALSLRQERFLFPHQMLSAGASMVFAEIGRDTGGASLRFAFLRGAARQYDARPWGVTVSPAFCGSSPFGNIPSVDWSATRWTGVGPDCGHSMSLLFRLLMAGQFAGATFIERGPDPRLRLSGSEPTYDVSFGDDVKTWQQYIRAHPRRGVPYTPFAFLMDFNHTWRPRESGISSERNVDGNVSIDAILRHVFAWQTDVDFEQGFLTNGPYGEVFDIVTDNASIGALNPYGMIWPLESSAVGHNTQETLVQYAKSGGILVLNAAVARAFPPQFLGVRFEPRTQIAAQIQTGLAALPAITAPYVFHAMAPSRSAEVLAWSDNGAPLLTWRKTGRGLVIVAATDSWLDERGQLLPLVPALMRAFADAFLPVQLLGDAQVFLNREPDGWIIALINNNGVAKVPTLPASIDPKRAADCILQFKKGVPLQFLTYLGEFRWNNRANGLYTRLQPGEIAVVKATLGNE